MKKISLVLMLLALIGISASAQTTRTIDKQHGTIAANKPLSHLDFGGVRTLDCDTFGNLIPCDTGLFYYYVYDVVAPTDSGYLSGHNFYKDKAKAELYTITGDTISGVWCGFAAAAASSNAAKISVKIWAANGTGGAPGTVLATKNVTIASIAADITAGNLTTVYFPTKIANPGTFYVGFTMTYPTGGFDPANHVTVTNNYLPDPCESDTARNTCYEQWSDNSWHDWPSTYGFGSTYMMFPIVCTTVAGCAVTIAPTSATICQKKSVSLTASGGTTYTWSPATGLNTTSGATVIAKPNTNTTYTVTSGACTAGTVTVTVNPLATCSITADPCASAHVLLHSNAVPNTGVSYKWYLNGGLISGATSATYSAPTSGSYKVYVTITATGCVKKSKAKTVTVSCRMGEFDASAFDVQAFPNPFISSISVNISSASTDAATLTLSDFSGRVIREYNNVDPTSAFMINETLAPGVYFIRVAQGDNSKMIKVVKSN